MKGVGLMVGMLPRKTMKARPRKVYLRKAIRRLEDVRQEHIDFVATKIMGWDGRIGSKISSLNWWKVDEFVIAKNKFNPFTNIEHAKMLDGWLVENTLTLDITLNKDYEGTIYAIIFNGRGEFVTGCISKSEPFARTVAILKAYIKLEVEGG
jgi:hypothetical protein